MILTGLEVDEADFVYLRCCCFQGICLVEFLVVLNLSADDDLVPMHSND